MAKRLFGAAFIFTLTLFCFATVAEAAVLSYTGKITGITGAVEVQRKGSTKKSFARFGDKLFAGDYVMTRGNSKAEITMPDKSKIYVAAKSKIKIGSFLLDRKSEKRKATINTYAGMIRVKVMKIMKASSSGSWRPWGNSLFQVRTPTAVVGVKGTHFIVNVDNKKRKTRVIVQRGFVNVRNVIPRIRNSVVLTKNMTTVVYKGKPPRKKKKVVKKEIIAMIEETAVKKKDKVADIEAVEETYDDTYDDSEDVVEVDEKSKDDEEEAKSLKEAEEDALKENTDDFESDFDSSSDDDDTTSESDVFGFDSTSETSTTTSTTSTSGDGEGGTTTLSGGGGTTCASEPC